MTEVAVVNKGIQQQGSQLGLTDVHEGAEMYVPNDQPSYALSFDEHYLSCLIMAGVAR